MRAFDVLSGKFAWAWDMGRPGVHTEPGEGESYTRGTPNVWSLTSYDFSPYPLDDAAIFAEHKVASVVTEYGFTRGSEAEMAARFNGDRVAAMRSGLARRWTDIYLVCAKADHIRRPNFHRSPGEFPNP